jgi:hypothetical protein
MGNDRSEAGTPFRTGESTRREGVTGAIKVTEYTCDGFYPVRAADIAHAAQLFAVQLARRKYGSKGRCRSVQHVHDI